MWKILLLQIFSVLISSINAADLYCTSFNYLNQCLGIDRITNVFAENEVINVMGQTSTYIDDETSSIHFDPNSQFDLFPTGIFNIFTHLNAVSFDGNGFSKLKTNGFNNCSHLKFITGSNYAFNHLPAGFAQNCLNLETINLLTGELTALDSDALVGLSALTTFYVIYNKITCIPPNFFAHTTELDNIVLSYNQIIAVDPITFRNLPKLSNLDLGQNNIAFIPNFDFTNTAIDSISNTLTISLMYNPLKGIDPTFIPTLFTARTLLNTHLLLNEDQNEFINCIPNTVLSFNQEDYDTANEVLSKCYSNWLPSMASTPVSCATSTSSSTSNPSNIHGALRVILSAFKNVSFSVNFI